MSEAPRRNSHLSAYYGLSNSPTQAQPSTREQALAHAAHLTKTLSLTQLLQHSKTLRKDSQHIQKTLNKTVHSIYTNLTTASQAASTTHQHANSLLQSTSVITDTQSITKTAQSLNDRLAASRAKINDLEASRTLKLLLQAAANLTDALPAHYRSLVDLCTDPQTAQTRLFRTARRTSIVLSALSALHQPVFQEAATRLRDAAAHVKDDLSAREPDESDALSLSECIQLRKLLGDDTSVLNNAFFQRASLMLPVQPVPNSLTVVQFVNRDVVGAVKKAVETFRELFGHSDEHQVVVWAADMAEETLGSRVRALLRGGMQASDMSTLLESLRRVAELSGGTSDMVESVFADMAVRLVEEVDEKMKEVAARVWQAQVDAVLEDGIVGSLDEGRPDEMALYAAGRAEGMGLRGFARAAMVCRAVGERDVELMLVERFRYALFEGLEDLLEGLVESGDVGMVTDVVKEAVGIGEECGISVVPMDGRDELEGLGEFEAVRVGWIEGVRRRVFTKEEVERVEGFVREFEKAIGIDGAFQAVGRAAKERCLEM